MSHALKKVTKTMFEPGRSSSRRYRRNETCIDMHLPAPEGPFHVLRFRIPDTDPYNMITLTVYLDGVAMIGEEPAEVEDWSAVPGEDASALHPCGHCNGSGSEPLPPADLMT